MPSAPLPGWIERHLEGPNSAVMGTVNADGWASTVPCWYRYGEGLLHLSMGRQARRLENLRRDPRVAFAIIVAPTSHILLDGRAVEFGDDPELRLLDSLSEIYWGKPWPDRSATPLAVTVEIDRWSSYGLARPDEDPG